MNTLAKPSVSTLLLWCIVCALLVFTSRVVPAYDFLPEAPFVLAALCLEPEHAALMPRPLKEFRGSVEQDVPVPRVTYVLEQKKSVRGELYIPPALWRGLLTGASDSVVELRVPEALLALMLTEGYVQQQRSSVVCRGILPLEE